MSEPTPPPPQDGRVLGWMTAVKGLTISNVLVIALLAVIAVPVYIVYRALNDEKIMDRLMSTYEEVGNQQSGCAVRHVKERGGPDLWGVSSGFAFQGADRWYVNVILSHAPTTEEIYSYCESLKLIADRMLARGGDDEPGTGTEVQPGSMQSPEANGRGHDGDMPADTAP